mgnify:CR=1 FL=1
MASALTAVRYRVVAMTMLMAGITYLDRVCISVLAPSIMRDLNITTVQMSYVFSAFTFAYALFEVPTAWWADRIGTRKVLTRIVLWWSVFTVATAAAWSYASMVVTRFLFGAGEAGAWPCVGRTFSRWIPLTQRGRVQGIFFSGAHLAGAGGRPDGAGEPCLPRHQPGGGAGPRRDRGRHGIPALPLPSRSAPC